MCVYDGSYIRAVSGLLKQISAVRCGVVDPPLTCADVENRSRSKVGEAVHQSVDLTHAYGSVPHATI